MASYFGHHVHPSTRCAVIGECAGTIKSERDKGNTLDSKQRRLLSMTIFSKELPCKIREENTQAHFSKEHINAPTKVKPFVDQAFDSHYVPLTYMTSLR